MFIVKKKIAGKEYYYLRESKRVDGKVKAVTLAYLGKTKGVAEEKKREFEERLIRQSTSRKIINDKKLRGLRDNNLDGRVGGEERDKKPKVEGKKMVESKVKITYFVHGTTLDNENGVSTGQAQGELSELGVKQSKELTEQLGNKKFDAIFSSDLKRAVDSAKLTWSRGEIIKDKRLRECNYGDLNQAKEDKVDYSKHIDRPFPNGESLKDVEKRIFDFLNFLKHKYSGKHIAIVAHKAPQLALDVLLGGKKWGQAIKEDWREVGKWQPGWDYEVRKEASKKTDAEEKEFLSFVQEGGLIWGPEPEIYGGLAGFYTYGPLGKLLKNKVENSVRRVFNMNGFREMEGPTVLPDSVWKASGHLDNFSDPMILTKDGEESYRADKLLEDTGVQVEKLDADYLLKKIKEHKIKAPNGKELGEKIESYSLMMKTKVAGVDASLRPETATVTYLPFPRALNYFRKKLPFGVYQIGKAYRNEISPRQSVLRGREFTQAEGQIFIDPLEKNNWEKFEGIKDEKLPVWSWEEQAKGLDRESDSSTNEGKKVDNKLSKELGDNDGGGGGNNIKSISAEELVKKKFVKSKAYAWCLWLAYQQFVNFGVPKDRIRMRQHGPDEKAFYADDAWDIEVNLKNYGWTEVCGVHDRTDYDLKQHAQASGEKLETIREVKLGEKLLESVRDSRYVPHVLEIAFGTDRPTYALIDLFYEKKEEGEGKTMFRVPYNMAPIDVSVFPLMKKPELLKLSERVRDLLGEEFVVDYDVSGSIGKRYLRSASAGTPFAITIDFDSLEGKDVTIRDRDSEKQIRVKIDDLRDNLRGLLNGKIGFGRGKVCGTKK